VIEDSADTVEGGKRAKSKLPKGGYRVVDAQRSRAGLEEGGSELPCKRQKGTNLEQRVSLIDLLESRNHERLQRGAEDKLVRRFRLLWGGGQERGGGGYAFIRYAALWGTPTAAGFPGIRSGGVNRCGTRTVRIGVKRGKLQKSAIGGYNYKGREGRQQWNLMRSDHGESSESRSYRVQLTGTP